MEGKGITLSCRSCGKKWTLTENGYLKADDGNDSGTPEAEIRGSTPER